MAGRAGWENRVRSERLRRGWSQDELAQRSGLSRPGVSAIETDRLVPSTAAALALAGAFACRVEDLFSLSGASAGTIAPVWAWEPSRTPCRYWRAEVGGRTLIFPVEATPMGVVPHDGSAENSAITGADWSAPTSDPRLTLVVACCDPAVGLLSAELARSAGIRLIALARSSRAALALLGQGLVHAAGVHLGRPHQAEGNVHAVRAALGPGYMLLRAARWEEGVTFSGTRRLGSVRAAVRLNLRWVGREAGSGARQCLDELLGDRRTPRHLANDHRGVAEAVRAGWADAGVCLRLTSEEAGLGFLTVREEAYDLCVRDSQRDDPRIHALLAVLRSVSYRRLLGELPGYDSRATGEVQRVS
jgi:molybdate-binding protein/DNA-binding XRE family transcriptional regulator